MKLFALALLAAALHAQSAATIRGFVWSSEGRPIPQAQVTIRSADSKSDQTITAGPDGVFVAPDLKPGRYDIIATAPNLQLATESITPVEVKAGQTAHADLTLGMSTLHHGFWSRLVRRLDGLH
jgi:hypothetical protein